MRKQKERRWILFLKAPSGSREARLIDAFLNPNDLVHSYQWEAVRKRTMLANPSLWGIARVEIEITPTTTAQ